MWLLDANMDVHLTAVLAEFGIGAETAVARGWKAIPMANLSPPRWQVGLNVY